MSRTDELTKLLQSLQFSRSSVPPQHSPPAHLHEAAQAEGFGIMVGCMVGTSLAMAPAMLLTAGAQIVDLDGPLLLAEDRDPSLAFTGAEIAPPVPALWG